MRRRYEGLDVVHYALTIQLPSLGLPKAVTIQDLQHLDLPHLFSRAERRFRRHAYEASVRSADAVIVPSQFVRRGIVEHLGVPPERVHSIPHGVDHERFFPTGEPREAFLLYPARPWPHKNHERLFEAFALLRRERPELELVLTGGGHERRPVPDGVTVRGLISRRRARLALPTRRLPRLSEPVRGLRLSAARGDGVRLSGRRLGTPARSPRRCGDAAALFDPTDAEDIAAVVAAVLESPERLVAAGLERAAQFTWAETARRHEAVYRSL